eukprot:TRINITY_DN166_c0_g1_i1.p1 TRINITY_DN166_c0_g1~~TRINITY_DN166_c0_g1_i1.p1  ORF type:complete len:274 (-),score=31.50 TRINITY_DN166_c0_g1_i1:114-866(-)
MLFELTLIDFSIQWAGCIHAVLSHTERFYDLIGALTNIFMVVYSYYYSSRSFQQLVCSLTITLWASRLGTFLFYRVLSAGEDKRFRKAKSSPLTMFVFWTLQGIWILMCGLPVHLVNSQIISESDFFFVPGALLFVFGFLFEFISDYQKLKFRSDPKNSNKFIRSGLWSVSRHPNYFGEIILQFGVYFACLPYFRGIQHLALISPLFTVFLLTRVSGIPILEKSADTRWAKEKDYIQYKKNTPCLIPRVL